MYVLLSLQTEETSFAALGLTLRYAWPTSLMTALRSILDPTSFITLC